MSRRHKTIIDQLREATIASGETQVELSKATGIDQGNLSKFLREERMLSLENAAALAAYLLLELAPRRR
jgi:transcriptional regulator with XRE-family HTH domain